MDFIDKSQEAGFDKDEEIIYTEPISFEDSPSLNEKVFFLLEIFTKTSFDLYPILFLEN